MLDRYHCEVEDTYAEAFRSLYAEFLITARDHKWLEHAVHAVTGHASSTVMCDSEAGLDRYVGPGFDESVETPDGRPGAVIQVHVPRFRKDRVRALEKVLLARISQNVLTCPTTACFNLLQSEEDHYYRMGRKIAYFGDKHETLEERHGRKMWVIPTMGGEFTIDRRYYYDDGIMGGNLWFMGINEDAALAAAERAVAAVDRTPGVITTFPGGIASSASKAGSAYPFLFASTYAEFCPTLKEKLGDKSQVPEDVTSIQEIIVNGRNLDVVAQAMYAAIEACHESPGLVKISAGNYNGRLGKSFIYLDQEKQAEFLAEKQNA